MFTSGNLATQARHVCGHVEGNVLKHKVTRPSTRPAQNVQTVATYGSWTIRKRSATNHLLSRHVSLYSPGFHGPRSTPRTLAPKQTKQVPKYAAMDAVQVFPSETLAGAGDT
eukprot:5225908-Pyramimonas_sp.AAC.1